MADEQEDGPVPATEAVLRWALAQAKPWIADPRKECSGADLVEWFYGQFVPKAQAALVTEEAVSERYRKALEKVIALAPASEPEDEDFDSETEPKWAYRNGVDNAYWHCAEIARTALQPSVPERPELVQAARRVVARWEKGDLAEAVRELAALVEEDAPGEEDADG